MHHRRRRRMRPLLAATLATGALGLTGMPAAHAQHPSWVNNAVIYCVFPEIFSSGGNLAGVSAQLSRLHSLGVNVIWIMPITPRGQATGSHPSYNSPYCVHDYYAIDPAIGASSDLTNLVSTAHSLGMKVILDEVLNHTAWDNALITQHPDWYVHTDGNPTNVNSIAPGGYPNTAWNDVAQLNYSSAALQSYMTTMLQWWISTYNIDGFRFDTADYPPGPNRNIPASFWQSLRTSLESVKSDILMLGECEDSALATTPFELDYGWNLHDALTPAIQGGNTNNVQSTWQSQVNSYPTGTLHMNIQDDWDYARDVNVLGSAGALNAAIVNFTVNGVPLLYNGMEVGNNTGGVNPHASSGGSINWSANPSFANFYTQLIALRLAHPALQQGTLAWESNSASGQVLTYDRTGNSEEFLIEDNLSGGAASGSISGLASGSSWVEVTPPGGPGGQSHTAPPNFSLQAHDFAIFQRTTTPPATPTNLVAQANSGSINLSWTAGSGDATYNLYRGTSAGGEGGTPIASGITGTAYADSGLTNGITYFYKVAGANGNGTSGLSNEASATPTAAAYTGTPYTGTPIALPGTLQAENFDKGGEGVAYHDTDAANDGGQYRTGEGVDIETCSDSGGGYDVGWTQPGEWMKYTVNVASSTTYTVAFRVASGIASGTAGTLHLEDETGKNLTGTVTVSSTGGWQSWVTVNASATLTSGAHVLKLVVDSGNGAFNINSVTFSTTAYSGTPYTGTPAALPGTIQFENFDKGGEGIAYHDTDAANDGGQYRTSEGVDIESCSDTGGGYDIGWTQPGEWMKYTVSAGTTKTYSVAFRVASGIASGTAGTYHIEDENGNNLSGTLTVSSTGGWQNWVTLNGNIALTAGTHVLKVVIDSGNGAFNLNAMTFN